MRRFWLVPVIALVLFMVMKPSEVGYSTLPEEHADATARPEATALVADAPPSATPDSPTATTPPESTATASATPPPAPTSVGTVLPTPNAEAMAAIPVRRAQPLAPDAPEQLEPETAPPTPAPTAIEAPAPSRPARLIIPAIQLDLVPVPVGLDEQRVPIVPKHDVGWFTSSSMPGQGSNVVFWGHVLRWLDSPDVPAPFARLHEVPVGELLTIVTEDGRERHYRVAQQIQVRPEEVQYILPTPTERVTLVSCIGDKVIRAGVLTKEFRLLTIAEPVEE